MQERTDFLKKRAEAIKPVPLSLRVPADVYVKLQDIASEAGMSMASLCREIFEIYLAHEQEILMVAEGKAKIVTIDDELKE